MQLLPLLPVKERLGDRTALDEEARRGFCLSSVLFATCSDVTRGRTAILCAHLVARLLSCAVTLGWVSRGWGSLFRSPVRQFPDPTLRMRQPFPVQQVITHFAEPSG